MPKSQTTTEPSSVRVARRLGLVRADPHAETALTQFRETADVRGWSIRAVAIMFNHFHIVVGVPGDPPPSKILGDFKSWTTRALSEQQRKR